MADMIILYTCWILAPLSLFLFIPREKVRLAAVAFMFKQLLTWPLGIFVAEHGWVEYPIRCFEHAVRTSFIFEFLIYPTICALFNVYYPVNRNRQIQVLYYLTTVGLIVLFELVLLHTTELIRYIRWTGWLSGVTLLISLYIDRRFCVWFFSSASGAADQEKNSRQ